MIAGISVRTEWKPRPARIHDLKVGDGARILLADDACLATRQQLDTPIALYISEQTGRFVITNCSVSVGSS